MVAACDAEEQCVAFSTGSNQGVTGAYLYKSSTRPLNYDATVYRKLTATSLANILAKAAAPSPSRVASPSSRPRPSPSPSPSATASPSPANTTNNATISASTSDVGSSSSNRLSAGAIAGIVFSAIAALAVLLSVACMWWRSWHEMKALQEKKQQPSSSNLARAPAGRCVEKQEERVNVVCQ
uniref:Uncharacterized protein n=1 Tax=Tetradesmus obliquus TaxID=3088 RepID=A0A383VBP6_TETOB|eukprot:jgi/Sobl393_1/18164/SZX62182.1